MKRIPFVFFACVSVALAGRVQITDTDTSVVAPVTTNGLAVTQTTSAPLPGVPTTFTKQSANSRTFVTRKGEINHYRLRPRILTEHVETARGAQATVTNGLLVGQIFRASYDNINGAYLTLESAASTVVDNFESYADSAALQAVWIETDPADPALLATIIVNQGNKSMLLPMDATAGDEWYKTNAATDYTGFTFSLDWYQTTTYSQSKMNFYIEDSAGNSKFLPLVVEDAASWEAFDFREEAMVETSGNTLDTDPTDIVRIGFRLFDTQPGGEGYADDVRATPAPGNLAVELWDMGATLPESGVTSLTDGTQYAELGDRGINGGTVASSVTVELIGGKRFYDVRQFVAGTALEIPGNTLITPGNYYAMVLKYVDTDVIVYGPNLSYSNQYYNSGYAFTAADTNVAISAIGTYSDLCFGIFTAQDAYLNTLITSYNASDGSSASPGEAATESVNIEDSNMYIIHWLVGSSRPQPFVEAEFSDTKPYLPEGCKFEVNHSDDFSDDVETCTVLIGYLHPTMNTYD